jgi:hypothetical protein
MFLKHMIWISQLGKKMRIFVKKIFRGWFLHVQNFMDILPLNLVLHNLFFIIVTL